MGETAFKHECWQHFGGLLERCDVSALSMSTWPYTSCLGAFMAMALGHIGLSVTTDNCLQQAFVHNVCTESSDVQALVDDGKLDMLQEMYQSWPFFSVTLDMMEMVFAKADPRVAQFYEVALVDKSLWPFGDDLRK